MKLNKPFPYNTEIDRTIKNIDEIGVGEFDLSELVNAIDSLKPILQNIVVSNEEIKILLSEGINVNVIGGESEPEPEPEPEPVEGVPPISMEFGEHNPFKGGNISRQSRLIVEPIEALDWDKFEWESSNTDVISIVPNYFTNNSPAFRSNQVGESTITVRSIINGMTATVTLIVEDE